MKTMLCVASVKTLLILQVREDEVEAEQKDWQAHLQILADEREQGVNRPLPQHGAGHTQDRLNPFWLHGQF